MTTTVSRGLFERPTKNKIINGNFDVWQRGVSQTSSGYGSDDRWNNSFTGATRSHLRQNFTFGQTDVPNDPKFFSRTDITVAGSAIGDFVNKYHKIEGVETLAGKSSVLSFWAKADSAKDIAVEFLQYFGSGGSPSATVREINVTTVSLTTSWQKYEVSVSLPSVVGKTKGTNGDDALNIFFWFDAGSDFDLRTNSLGHQSGTFDIAQVQLEEGDSATEFEDRHISEEIALCQRYYQANTVNNNIWSGNVVSGHAHFDKIGFAVRMRTVPSCTATLTADSSFGSLLVDTNRTYLDKIVVTATTTANDPRAFFQWAYTADAEL